MRVSPVLAVAVHCLTLAACAVGAQEVYYGADAYMPAEALPAGLYGKPVGTSMTLSIRLPEDYDAKAPKLAILWMEIDDIDAAKEGCFHVNGVGPFAPAKEMIGEGISHPGYLKIDPAILKRGVNEVKLTFLDNLGGSTGGWDVLDARLILVRQGEPKPLAQLGGSRIQYLEVAGLGKLAIYNASLDPRKIAMTRDEELTWKPHLIRRGDGSGGWILENAEHRFLHAAVGKHVMPFGLARMDNGEVILAAGWNDGERTWTVVAFSKDSGDTWSDWHWTGGFGRPMMLAHLGKGNLTYKTGPRFHSSDYGRTWPRTTARQKTSNGSPFHTEGNPLVDYDENGDATRIAEVGFNFGPPGSKYVPKIPSVAFFRWSNDLGKTWTDEVIPKEWQWEDTWQGKTWTRCISEGSLVRAANGWIVAALRTDMPAKFFTGHNDNAEGTGVSISKDDGKTWSPIQVLFAAGRMHANFVKLADGRLVMHVVVRRDMGEDLTYASFNRGSDAVISNDNGLTWDLSRKVVLDAWPHLDGETGLSGTSCGHTASVALADGRVLSAYGHYPSKGIALIRWKP